MDPENELTSETRALLDRARGGDGLPKAHRAVLRRRLAGALGLAAPLAVSTSAAASAALWAARGLAVIGAAGVVHLAAHGGIASMVTHHASPAVHAMVTAVAPVHPLGTVAPSLVPPPPPPPSASAPVEAPVAAIDATPAVAPAPAVAVAPAVPAARTSAAPAIEPRHPRRPVAALPESTDVLADEVRLVAAARAALEAREGTRALALLAEHDRRFAAGTLSPEAEALHIEALCSVGRHADAQAEQERFLARHPGSPLARRFAIACGP